VQLLRTALLAAFILEAVPAVAETCPATPTCDPRTEPDRSKCGPELGGKSLTPAGSWRAYWWRISGDSGQPLWCSYLFTCLEKFCTVKPDTALAIMDTVLSAPTIAQGLVAANTAFAIKPAAGSQDEYDYLNLRYIGCLALDAAPPATAWAPGHVSPCKAPIPPSTAIYTATGGSIYTVVNGKIGAPTGRRATAGAACICSAVDIVNSTGGVTSHYCPLSAGPPNEVTQVKKQ